MDPVDSLLDAADAAVTADDLPYAGELLEAGSRRYRDDVRVWTRLGEVDRRRRRYAERVRALREAARLAPDAPDIMAGFADALRLDYRANESLTVTLRWTELTPESPAAWNAHALALVDTDQPDRALPILVDLAARHPDRAEHRISLARALVKTGRFRDADAVAGHVVADVPAYPGAYPVIAAANHGLRRYRQWTAAAAKAAALDPDGPVPLLWQARMARHTGTPADESDFLVRALALQPRLIEARVLLAQVYWRAGDLDRAHGLFREAFALNRLDGLARGAIADFQVATGRGEILLDVLEEEAFQRPYSGLCRHLGAVFVKLREYERAVRLLETGLAHCGESVDTMLRLAEAYQRAGRLPDARRTAGLAKDLVPDDSEVDALLDRLGR